MNEELMRGDMVKHIFTNKKYLVYMEGKKLMLTNGPSSFEFIKGMETRFEKIDSSPIDIIKTIKDKKLKQIVIDSSLDLKKTKTIKATDESRPKSKSKSKSKPKKKHKVPRQKAVFDRAKHNEHVKEYKRRIRAERRVNHLCTECGVKLTTEDIQSNKARCKGCRLKHFNYYREKRVLWRGQGRCSKCGSEDVQEGYFMCVKCVGKQRKYNDINRQKRAVS